MQALSSEKLSGYIDQKMLSSKSNIFLKLKNSIKASLSHYRAQKYTPLLIRRIKAVVCRLIWKYVLRNKKVLNSRKGIIVIITGPDGAGKLPFANLSISDTVNF